MQNAAFGCIKTQMALLTLNRRGLGFRKKGCEILND